MHSKNASRRSGATTLGAVLLVAAFILTSVAEAATVKRGPYLQMGTQDRIVVRWRTDVPTDSRVSYGLCFGEQNCLIWERVDQSLTTEHEVLLDGLAPNTRYYYAVGTTTEVLAGNDSSHSFLTAPPIGLSKRTRIWVLGDSGTGTISAHQVRDAYYAYPGSEQTDLWLMLGDNAYNRGTDSEYQSGVFNEYPEMLRRSVLWPSFGNHDGSSADAATQTGPYFDIFTLPRNAEAGGVPSGTEAYYSYDHANIHFVVLDSFGSDRSPDGAMLTWLRADLEANRQDWTIAYWHHPPYSKGSHNSNTETALKQMRQNALPILEEYGVDLVLAGHSHAYERSHLLDGHYGLSSTLVPGMILNAGGGNPDGSGAYTKPQRGPDPHKGTVYVVAGSSGKLSSEGLLNHPAMFISLELLGSLVLTVNGNRLDAEFLQSTGTVRDVFTILKGSPSNIEVTPNIHAYGSVAVGTDTVQTFDVRNRGLVDLQVTPALFGDEAAEFSIVQGEAPFTIAPGEAHTIDLRFAPMSEGPKSTLLRLTTNEPDQSPVDAALSGIGTTEPDIDVTLTALDYGDVLVGTTSTQTFTIQNVGTADLELTAVDLVGGDASEFGVAEGSAPFIIAPGAAQNVNVHFAPSTGGPKTTTLRLTSDDPDESPFDVTLSGTATTAPDIDVSLATHNYGVVWVGREAVQTFAVRNTGSADLQVIATGLVGGDVTEFGTVEGTAPFTLAPGATQNLVVRFAPLSPGAKATTVRLTSDDQDEPLVDLFLVGTAILPPDVDVVATPDYGDVVIGTVAFKNFIIRNLGGAELQVSGTSLVEGQAQEFAITQGAAPFVVSPGEVHTIEIRFAPASRGPRTSILRLTSDDPDESAVDMVVSGNGLLPPDIDLASAPPDYGEVVVGTTASRPFVIRNLGDVELQVAPGLVNGQPGEFAIAQGTASFTVMPGASYSLDIQFAPSSGGPKTTTLRLSSDDQDEPTIDVAVGGIGMMPPDIDLVPTPPDYGQVLVGAAMSKTFVIRNLGDVALQAAAIVVNGETGEFTVSPVSASFTVLPGASHNVDVVFAPLSGGPKATTLRLMSDDADEATVDLALSGIGLMPADINLAATTHDYGQVVVGTTISVTIVVQNLGDVALQVMEATLFSGESGEFAISQGGAPFTVAPGATHAVDVGFAPTSGGIKTASLRLHSDDADEATVDVGLSGIGLMPADIELGAPSHDYGQVVVGTTLSQTVIVRNLGDVDLHVTATTLVDGQATEFVITQGGAPFAVVPGGTHTIHVQFAPGSRGAKTTKLRLLNDDADESVVEVSLSGMGLMPPDIDLSATTHDYGQVVVGTTASQTVVIRNLGDVVLQVSATTLVNGEVDQFTITHGGAPFTVAPGGTHSVNVRFAPASGGVKHATLHVLSDDADEATREVALSGMGLMPADIDLAGMTHDYGQVVVGTSAVRTIVVRNLGDVNLQVTGANLTGGEVNAFAIVQGGAPFTVAPGATHAIDVRFAPASGGSKTTTLGLISDDADEPTVQVALSGIGLMPADIDLAAPSHDYGQVVVGTTASHTVVVRNLGDVDLHVTTATLVDGQATEFVITEGGAPFAVAPGGTYTIHVQFAPGSRGAKTTKLRLLSDDADESAVEVSLSGMGLMPPDIDLSTTTHDYGQVVVGTTASQTVVIRNLGDVVLQVSATTLVNGEIDQFTITQGAAPFTVAPGGTHSVNVRFAPASGGVKHATLRVLSDDADEAAIDVALSGMGLMPADIDLAAMAHDYGQVVVGTSAVRTIVVRNLGDVNLQVTGANLTGGEVNAFAIVQGGAPFTVAPGATHAIDVRFAPASGGSKTTTLGLISDDADEPTVQVALSGIGLMPADIDLTTITHDYGQIVVGTSAVRTIGIRNLGDVNLHVTAAHLVGGEAGEFSITQGSAPFTVASGATHTLDIHFTPASGGLKAATLRFLSDDADEATVDVTLRGTGLMPPDIDLAETAHDYGSVVVGTTASRTVVVRNLGDVELQITATNLVGGEQGEFAITQGGAPFTVAPGGTHTLDVRFAPSTGGSKTTSLRLASNDADEPNVDVALSGMGLMPADIDFGAMTHDYGQVVVGTTASQTVIVRNLGDVALQVSSMTLVTGEAAEFSIALGAAPFTVAPGATHAVDVRFAPGSAGQKTSMLRVVSDDQDEDTVNVTVTGRGLMPPDIDLAPVAHDYGQAIVGTTASRVFVIGNLGDVDLHVTASSIVGGESAQFVLNDTIAFTVAPGATHSLEVRFVPTSGGPKGATLRLVSDDPNEGTVDVPLGGVGMMPPDIDVGPTPHDYGDVLVGTTALRTFVIRNLGDVALQVTTTSLAGSDAGLFAIAQGGAPFTVAPGGTHNLEVGFAPTSGGLKTATLRLTSDDSDESAVDVALSGTATTAPEVAVVLTPIHYGETLVGTTNSRTFTVENVGSADLHATASLVGGGAGEFAVAPASFTVAPGATHTIDVTFVPTSGGPKATTLRLASDDADEATIDVSIDGIGMMPADIDPAPMAHDFGEVLLGSTASRTFTIRNLGDVNLHVNLASLVDGDAGEFAVAQGHAPFTVAPGAIHNLDVRFAPVSAGPKTTRLRLTSDDQDESVIDVVITGIATTAPELEVVSATENYGVVWVGSDASRTFVIRNVGSADLQVVTSSMNGSEAGEFAIMQGAAPFTLAPGGTHSLDVRFAPAAVGTRTATVRLTSNDQDEATVDLVVAGTGIMPPDIDRTPTEHDYGEVVVGMTRSRTVAIRNLGGANLQVTAASVVGGEAGEFAITQGTAPFTVVAGATHSLEIRLAPTSEGPKTATLRLTSNDPDESTVDVHLSGTGTLLVPDIATVPESHDYGSRAAGTSVIQGFIVSNTGTKNLVVGMSTLSGPNAESFTVVTGPAGFTLAPGATRLVEIRFSPTTGGPKSATLTIPSDDPDENPVLIPLSGTTPPTFMEAGEGGSANASTVTTETSLTGVSGHLYLAAVSTKPHRQVSTMTGMGLTWIRVGTQCAGRNQTGIELWWAQGAASSGQVTATLVSAPNNAVIAVARYGGVALASPVMPLVTGNTNGISGGCGNATDTATYLFNVSPTQSNSLVVGAVALRNKIHNSASGYATRLEISHGNLGNVAGIALVDRAVAVTTVLPLNGTLNGAVDWAIIGVELRSLSP